MGPESPGIYHPVLWIPNTISYEATFATFLASGSSPNGPTNAQAHSRLASSGPDRTVPVYPASPQVPRAPPVQARPAQVTLTTEPPSVLLRDGTSWRCGPENPGDIDRKPEVQPIGSSIARLAHLHLRFLTRGRVVVAVRGQVNVRGETHTPAYAARTVQPTWPSLSPADVRASTDMGYGVPRILKSDGRFMLRILPTVCIIRICNSRL